MDVFHNSLYLILFYLKVKKMKKDQDFLEPYHLPSVEDF